MALTLYVDTARWRAHHKHVPEQFPGLDPVCKGNGYGFGHEKLAEEATRLGSDILARVLVAPAELPVGVVTAFLGAPLFIALCRRRKLRVL